LVQLAGWWLSCQIQIPSGVRVRKAVKEGLTVGEVGEAEPVVELVADHGHHGLRLLLAG
jgi:hypothetical protein